MLYAWDMNRIRLVNNRPVGRNVNRRFKSFGLINPLLSVCLQNWLVVICLTANGFGFQDPQAKP
jgi:hypothetical protein